MNVGEAYPHIGIGPQDELYIAIVVDQDGEAFYAYTPGLQGIHVNGATPNEAFKRAQECAVAYLESLNRHKERLVEGPGVMIRRYPKRTTLSRKVRTQCHWIKPHGTNSKTLQPTG